MKHTTPIHSTDMKTMVPQRICHTIEERSNLLVGLLPHVFENLFDQMRLIPTTGLNDQLTWRGTLTDQFSLKPDLV